MRLVVMFLALITSCVTKPITLPDGSQGYAVACKNNLAACYTKASRLCPEGYEFIVEDQALVVNGIAGAGGVSSTNISKIVKCKTGASVEPSH